MNVTRRLTTLVAAAAIALAPLAAVSAAQAAEPVPLTNVTATSSTTIGTTGTNASAITISATIATGVTGNAADEFRITLPTGWSFVTTQSMGQTCPSWITVSGVSPSRCGAPSTNAVVIGPSFLSGAVIEVTFEANSLNVGTSRGFLVQTFNGPSAFDSGTATLAGGGTPNPSPAPTPTPAPDPAADSSTAATLAQTGTENGFVTPIAAALLLAAAGGAAILVRRRKA